MQKMLGARGSEEPAADPEAAHRARRFVAEVADRLEYNERQPAINSFAQIRSRVTLVEVLPTRLLAPAHGARCDGWVTTATAVDKEAAEEIIRVGGERIPPIMQGMTGSQLTAQIIAVR